MTSASEFLTLKIRAILDSVSFVRFSAILAISGYAGAPQVVPTAKEKMGLGEELRTFSRPHSFCIPAMEHDETL